MIHVITLVILYNINGVFHFYHRAVPEQVSWSTVVALSMDHEDSASSDFPKADLCVCMCARTWMCVDLCV